ncbi:TPA: recombinase family protein [Yersinia enterocolitica]|uniref:recombinase family protein n=1 Tax=Yersinia enterocolitica TaxID=630 RepID=UPI001C8DAEC5|nr:recombinase family protein [Yersinia enterocolitica]MBX9494954.1 recombinase family protein [Yersinia enterocolitica]HEI6718582.1 recombinase family protein [Yersinia enterocolitica]HEI6819726.1 recombinase family protein [Yersinia enterocolitica]HEI6878801.1 recombinase family protein [Yersinia enterocolitica]
MRVYCYLRASTDQQDATRAKSELEDFAQSNNFRISKFFIENESGASLLRPELFRLLDIAERGDVLLCEQIDRVSRLTNEDWKNLRRIIESKGVRLVSLDLPTSHQLLHSTDEFTQRMFEALNSMMLDMLAAIARKDYEDRRRRQKQGIEKAKANNRYKGRPIDQELHRRIAELLSDGKSWNKVQDLIGCSRATVAKVSKKMAITAL